MIKFKSLITLLVLCTVSTETIYASSSAYNYTQPTDITPDYVERLEDILKSTEGEIVIDYEDGVSPSSFINSNQYNQIRDAFYKSTSTKVSKFSNVKSLFFTLRQQEILISLRNHTEPVMTEQEIDWQIFSILLQLTREGRLARTAPDYNNVKEIFTYVCETLDYPDQNIQDPKYQTLETALTEGTVVCNGYTALFNRLLEAYGYEAEGVYGQFTEYTEQKHIWSKVYIDEEWKYFDVTLADEGDTANYKWSFMSYEDIMKDRIELTKGGR